MRKIYMKTVKINTEKLSCFTLKVFPAIVCDINIYNYVELNDALFFLSSSFFFFFFLKVCGFDNRQPQRHPNVKRFFRVQFFFYHTCLVPDVYLNRPYECYLKTLTYLSRLCTVASANTDDGK